MPFSVYSRQHLSSDSDFYVNLYTSPWPAHPLEHFSSDSDPYVNLYTGPLVRHFDSGSASANEVSEPDPYLNANDPPMNHFTEPALSEGRLGTDRKRKAEDDHQHEGRRVRSAASPPSAL